MSSSDIEKNNTGSIIGDNPNPNAIETADGGNTPSCPPSPSASRNSSNTHESTSVVMDWTGNRIVGTNTSGSGSDNGNGNEIATASAAANNPNNESHHTAYYTETGTAGTSSSTTMEDEDEQEGEVFIMRLKDPSSAPTVAKGIHQKEQEKNGGTKTAKSTAAKRLSSASIASLQSIRSKATSTGTSHKTSKKKKPEKPIAIIGAGVAGVAMAGALMDHNITDFVVFEKNAGPGGLWYDNYPGAKGKNSESILLPAISFVDSSSSRKKQTVCITRGGRERER